MFLLRNKQLIFKYTLVSGGLPKLEKNPDNSKSNICPRTSNLRDSTVYPSNGNDMLAILIYEISVKLRVYVGPVTTICLHTLKN